MDKTKIVKVRFESIYEPKTFAGREYVYFCELTVNVGDIVVAPTCIKDGNAIITQINVPIEDIKGFEDKIKIINRIIDKEVFLNGIKD